MVGSGRKRKKKGKRTAPLDKQPFYTRISITLPAGTTEDKREDLRCGEAERTEEHSRKRKLI